MLKAFRSLKDIENAFPEQENCYEYMEWILWKNKVCSPFTGTTDVTRVDYKTHLCKTTNKRFTVTTGTIFSGTRLPLIDWFKVIWLGTTEPGLSSLAVAKRTGVTQRTVWNMQKKIKLVKKSITDDPRGNGNH